jgi:hypothetical protein
MVGIGTKEEKSEALMSYYPAASLRQVMAVLSGTRVVRIMCVCVWPPLVVG